MVPGTLTSGQIISLAATPMVLIISGMLIASSGVPGKKAALIMGGLIALTGVSFRILFGLVLTEYVNPEHMTSIPQQYPEMFSLFNFFVGAYCFHAGAERAKKKEVDAIALYAISLLHAVMAIQLLGLLNF
ncbi:MAG: hypothetical protein UZ22_OP11002000452 [Microgenomates bacterium OLB23]|nr:MAG: hypothetical protein UZ22_OP11002000452 [Microgenomates bacterium OLB23]